MRRYFFEEESPVEKKTRSVLRVALFAIASVALILFYGSLFASRTPVWVPADIGVVALATEWGVVLLVSPREKLLRRVLAWYMTFSSILVAVGVIVFTVLLLRIAPP
jgi:ABC-type enterochelin transport system permease subunit